MNSIAPKLCRIANFSGRHRGFFCSHEEKKKEPGNNIQVLLVLHKNRRDDIIKSRMFSIKRHKYPILHFKSTILKSSCQIFFGGEMQNESFGSRFSRNGKNTASTRWGKRIAFRGIIKNSRDTSARRILCHNSRISKSHQTKQIVPSLVGSTDNA